MIKLRSIRLCRGMSFKLGSNGRCNVKAQQEHHKNNNGSKFNIKGGGDGGGGEIKWEVRPGGMLVQKRTENVQSVVDLINVRVSTLKQWHHVSIEATSTIGELKMMLSLVSGLEPKEQRVLFKGKEREDEEYLHMVGVKDKDKVFLLQDPSLKDLKIHGLMPKI